MDDTALEKAMATARHFLSDIEAAFPLRADPHTWRSKARWALKDKKLLEQLYERLQTVETTLQGILLGQQVFQMAVIRQSDDKSTPTALQARLDEIEEWPLKDASEKPPDPSRTAETITRPSKYLPSTGRFDRWGFSAHLVALPGPKNTTYRAAAHVSLLGKMYSVQLRLSTLDFPFAMDRKGHVRNVVPNDSAMALACRAGDFDKASTLLAANLAHGSDVTAAGWPMLDVSPALGFKGLRDPELIASSSLPSKAGLRGSSTCSSTTAPIRICLTGNMADTDRDGELGDDEVFWDAADGDDGDGDGEGPIYGADDVDDRWTLLHWASYNGSPKIKRLLLLKGVDPKHLDAIKLEDNPTLLPVSPFEGRY